MTPRLDRLQHLSDHFLLPLATVFAVGLFALFPNAISLTIQIAGLALMVIILGLPHGALDPWIAEQAGLQRTLKHQIAFNLAYLFVGGCVVVAWTFAPVVCLLIFLLISAWHFSADWAHQMPKPLQLLMGCLLILMPIGFHTDQVALIFSHLSGDGGARLAYFMALDPLVILAAMMVLIAYAALTKATKAMADFVALLVLSYVAPPLVYFALYFCLLHSPRHLIGIFRSADTKHHKRLAKMMAVYTLLTLVPIGLLAGYWFDLAADALYLRLVFIGLAAVTVPHMLLIAFKHYRVSS